MSARIAVVVNEGLPSDYLNPDRKNVDIYLAPYLHGTINRVKKLVVSTVRHKFEERAT
jgi:hypothetical protein